MNPTPKSLGYQMPAEWQEHSATWLAWPYDLITFPDRLNQVEQVYCQIIEALSQQEKIKIIIQNEAVKNKILKKLESTKTILKNVEFYITDYADVWLRDYGPTFLKNNLKEKAWVKWQYNAYGHKFTDLLKDNNVFDLLDKKITGQKFLTDFIMEGGAMEVNGQGLALTTEECLLNPNRNSSLSKQDTEQLLKDYLGVDKVIWLKQGLVNDHTDGHIDEIARFVNTNTILVTWTDDKNNPNYERLVENYNLLLNQTTAQGDKLNIVKLPLPEIFYDNGQLMPASYANFYLANNCLLLPKFNLPSDQEAQKIIGHYFSDRLITLIDCNDLLYGGGAIHCITQQEPV
ncbi:agmatine deiminase family protein [Patescibacteria group bacterium]|nr:agmatine deiminase family protein [Patescibacteria group bacterium]